jgi:hypothetical protein
MMSELQSWKKVHFKSVAKEIDKKRSQLDNLRSLSDEASRAARIGIEKEMDELLYREEIMWMQRSRIAWLREGDRNTKFFHSKAVWRARKNKIKRLQVDDGNWQTEQGSMGRMATAYFKNLFTADPGLVADPVLGLFEEKITPDMNEKLCSEFSDKEISDALFQIGPLKAPGPDGFPARFFQRNWGALKEEIIAGVKNFFQTGVMPAGVNDTTIVLIPKMDDPENLTHFRPISLCNVIYKVVSKCLVNRLRPLLDDIISEAQSAFVPGRLITDNAMLAFECIHHIQQEKDPEKSFCAYKLDLSKAYDRVDWVFLEQMMLKLGFAHQWVHWIMRCVTSVRYSVKLNGTLLESFAPSRGLRQGDPLSPFLFLFVADGLAALLKQGMNSGMVEPIKVCRRAPGVSHLLFADDTLLFFKADPHQAQHVSEIIDTYASATGQLINRAKCSILFGPRCPPVTCTSVRQILQVQPEDFEDKYLGLPTPQGRMHKGRFQNLQARLLKRMLVWGDGIPSQAGKETLIKSIAQAIPTYITSVFKLPMAVCDDLMRMVRNYWWGSSQAKRKTHWISWDKITMSKDHGGLGFRNVRVFNQALLARQAWRLLTNPNSLCARVLKAKYYPNGVLQDTVFSANASPTWQGVQHGLELLKKGLVWRVGNGEQIRVWRDPWLPRPHSYRPISEPGDCRLRRVSAFISEHGSWNMQLVRKHFVQADVEVIEQIKLSPRRSVDVLAWAPSPSAVFSVKSAYWLGMNELSRPSQGATSRAPNGRRAIWKALWGCPAPPKVRIFGWKLATNSLATWENKKKRNMEITDTCVICGMECESTFHTFCRCPMARNLWQAMKEVWPLPSLTDLTSSGSEWLLHLLDGRAETVRVMILMTLWRIWYCRNEVVHLKPAPPIEVSKGFLCSYLQSILTIKHFPEADPAKGKTLVFCDGNVDNMATKKAKIVVPQRPWRKPPEGHVKLNVDGSFCSKSGTGGCGVILRNDGGAVIVSASSYLPSCMCPLEAELEACRQGLALALDWSNLPCLVEMDCCEAVKMIRSGELDRSPFAGLVQEIKHLMAALHSGSIATIGREQNLVSHLLANLGRTSSRSQVWPGSGPELVLAQCHTDCSHVE